MKMLLFMYFALFVATKCASGEVNLPEVEFETKNSDEAQEGRTLFDSCLPLNLKHSRIHDEILGNDYEVERIVIYLYRIKSSKKTFMFIPNKQKQHCFPDLHNNGDLTVVISRTFQQILDTSPNVMTLGYQDEELINDGSKEIDFHKGFIETQRVDFEKDEGDKVVSKDVIEVNEGENQIPGANPLSKDTKDITHLTEEEDPNSKPNIDEVVTEIKESTDLINKAHNVDNDNTFVPLRALLGKQRTFDRWFTQQMLRFRDIHQRLDITDLNTLKITIEKTLRDNLIYIRSDGVIIDHHGTIIDPINLKLRPIIIGDSVTYKKLLSTHGNTYFFDKYSPYLDTVVLTQVFPPRLLGIIPLGKTLLPRLHSRRLINGIPLKTDDVNEKAGVRNFEGVSRLSLNPTKAVRTSRNLLDYENNNNLLSESKYPLDILGLLDSYRSVFGLRSGKPEVPKNIGSVSTPSEDTASEEQLDMDDDLGFKIIGGNAATSSGTPLSSRGRSSIF